MRAIDAALYWHHMQTYFACVMAPPIGCDRWRCPKRLGMMVPVLLHWGALPPPPPSRCMGRPFVPPMRWWEAQHRVLLLEGLDPQGEGHGCAMDAIGRICDTVMDRPTVVENPN